MRTPEKRREDAMELVQEELRVATFQHGAFASAHEGLSVIEEEVDELRKEVYKRRADRIPMALIKEAKHTAAMGLRFMIDIAMPLCEKEAERDRGPEKTKIDPKQQEIDRLKLIIQVAFDTLKVDGPNTRSVCNILYGGVVK